MNKVSRLEFLEERSSTSPDEEREYRVLQDLTFARAVTYGEIFLDLLKAGSTRVRLDLSALSVIDSAGVSTLVKLRRGLEGSGGGLTLLDPPKQVEFVLKLVGLLPLVKHRKAATPAAAPAAAAAPAKPRPAAVNLELSGDITSINAKAILDELLTHVRTGASQLRLNVSRVGVIDSSGLGALVRVSRAIGGDGGELVLIAPHETFRRILKIARLDTAFKIED